MRKTFFRTFLILACAASAIPNAGCSGALKRGVLRHTSRGEYAQALDELERAGVGIVVAPDASEEKLQARAAYQEAVEKRFIELSSQALREGKVRASLRKAQIGMTSCPWSPGLSKAVEERQRTVTALDDFSENARRASAETLTAEDARSLLVTAQPFRDLMADSPEALDAFASAERAIIESHARELRADFARIPVSQLDSLRDDLSLTRIESRTQMELVAAFRLLNSLPWEEPDTRTRRLAPEDIKGLREHVARMGARSSGPTTGPLDEVLTDTVTTWSATPLCSLLHSDAVSFELIDLSEAFLARQIPLAPSEFRACLARGLCGRAGSLATDGKGAALSLLYLARADALAANRQSDGCDSARVADVAAASFVGSEPLSPTIAIDVDPEVDPTVNQWLRAAMRASIETRTLPHCRWRWVDQVYEQAEVVVSFDAGELRIPSTADLNSVTSSYLSHFEDVPNPEKKRLGNLVDLAKIDIAYKKVAYESAVSSHNVYPTEWSLSAANNAYSSYKMAVDWHNTVVALYNATPTTISEPVYLPYVFHEGWIEQGWQAKGRITVGGSERPFDVSSLDRDFVRLGARFNDINADRRRDDPVNINTSADRLIEQLVEMVSRIDSEFDRALLDLPIPRRLSQRDREGAVLSWMLHPFGAASARARLAELPDWVVQTGVKIKLPESRRVPPPIALTRSGNQGRADRRTAEQLAADHRQHICQIISRSEGAASLGSGVLVSGDGLILTCAHVLTGNEVAVRFVTAMFAGEYVAKPVFINEAADVALVQAAGLRCESWMDIRLDALPRAGEAVLAIGNPSLPGGTTVEAAISTGVVSMAEAMYWQQPRVVADITVASGSSGGPLVSLDTGEIVGIVVAVAPAGMTEQRAASGFFCLAAPTRHLGDWLGVHYSKGEN